MILRLKTVVLATVCMVFALNVWGQDSIASKTEQKIGVVPDNYNFWIYTPDGYDGTKEFPLVVFLHGKSLSGTNLNRVLRYGTQDAIKKGLELNTLVITPQCSGGWQPDKLMALIDWVEANYKVDTKRIYVLGMSMGGYGTLNLVGTYPERFAAAMALCGGTTLSDMDGLGKLPLWILHGTGDKAVSVSKSKRIVSYLKDNKKDELLRYDWLHGANHSRLARLFYKQETYDWLLSHSLDDNPRKVEKDIKLDLSTPKIWSRTRRARR